MSIERDGLPQPPARVNYQRPGWHAFGSERNERQRVERRGVGMLRGGREPRDGQFARRCKHAYAPADPARSIGSGTTGRRHATPSLRIIGRQKHATRRTAAPDASEGGDASPPPSRRVRRQASVCTSGRPGQERRRLPSRRSGCLRAAGGRIGGRAIGRHPLWGIRPNDQRLGWHAFGSERNERQRVERRGVGMLRGGRKLREERLARRRKHAYAPADPARSVGSGTTGRRHATQSLRIIGRQEHATRPPSKMPCC